jgi:sugar phosphate isomerase/epimerase
MKKLNACIILMLISLLGFFPFNEAGNDHLVEHWQVGTYTGMLDEFSQEELVSFREKGIKYLELSINPLLRMNEEERVDWINDFKEKLVIADLEVWSVHMPWSNTIDISTTNDEDRENTINIHISIMELLEPLNVQKYVMHPSAEPIADEERDVRLANSIQSFKILTEEAKKYNGTIAMEAMPRTLLANTSDEALHIVHSVGNGLEICLDTNHILQETTEEFIRKVGNHITTLHVADYDGEDERHWIPGRGVINWNNVIDELVNIGFDGPWMYEVVRREGDDPMPTAGLLVENWEKLKNNYLETLN